MNLRSTAFTTTLAASLVALFTPLSACTAVMGPTGGSGGVVGTGGGATGGAPSGGGPASGGGSASGGSPGTGGLCCEPTSGGGTASGGAGTGGGGDWRDEDFGSIDEGPTFQFVRKIAAIWGGTACTASDCHGGIPAHVRLIPDEQLYDILLTSDSNNVCLDDQGMPMKLIVPGEPENSGFLRILREDCENQGRMPDSCTGTECLSDVYTGYVEQWIANGALETESGTGSGGAGSGGASSGGSGGTP